MLSSLAGVHFLITYGCTAECEHCFIWGSPRKQAGMTVAQVERSLDEIAALGTVKSVCAEGGEAFLRYHLVLALARGATARGLTMSALTNAFWVTSRDLAERRLAELQAAGLTSLGISTDQWHRAVVPLERVETLLSLCEAAGLPANRMETCLEGVMFRGRAAARLAPFAPPKAPQELTRCPHENLAAPSRVHLDCYGRLHLCQGLCVGAGGITEAWSSYHPATHPLVRLLLEGGPYALAQFAAERGFTLEAGYADACHLCDRAREFLRADFPELLGPEEMYGE